MPANLTEQWPLILIGVIVIVAILWLLLRPKQKVTLSSDTPVRPHMQPPGEGKGIAREAAAATSDVAGQFLGAHVHEELPGATGAPDPLQQLKGVGPKMASLLNERGITRFDQIAKLTDDQVDALDESLGAFRGRFSRDRIVEQAHYLARGDIDGYEQKFGKL
jgi:predicted flap endonuclease-1-like 5' DNA nuclease